MKPHELAVAIDTARLAAAGPEWCNPYFCAVPAGLTGQALLKLVLTQGDSCETNATTIAYAPPYADFECCSSAHLKLALSNIR